MTASDPRLDHRTFADLKEEARRRIPTFTPEWTDFNESGPGSAIIDLFALWTEMILHRFNAVPDTHFAALLDSIGIRTRPAVPAVGFVTFAAQEGGQVESVPRGYRVTADGGDAPIHFETQRGLELISAPLEHVRIFQGTGFENADSANRTSVQALPAGKTYRPFGFEPQVGTALLLGFKPVELAAGAERIFPSRISMRVFMDQGADGVAYRRSGCAIRGVPAPAASREQAETARRLALTRSVIERFVPPDRRDEARVELERQFESDHPSIVVPDGTPDIRLVWEYLPRDGQAWEMLPAYRDETDSFRRGGTIEIGGPKRILAAKVDGMLAYWIKCRIRAGNFGAGEEPVIDVIRPNTVEVNQRTTVRDEALAPAQGRPQERRALRYSPVVSKSVELAIQNAAGEFESWTEVERFPALDDADADRKVYRLYPASGEIEFGDGLQAEIPGAGAEMTVRSYAWGGGAAGNVRRGSIAGLSGTLIGIDSCTNERASTGGADADSIEELKRRAPRLFRSRGHLVTAKDFADEAQRAGDVVRAHALECHHPSHPDVGVPGAVTVVIVPKSDQRPALPSPQLLESVCSAIEKVRPVGAEVYVTGPRYHEVRIESRVFAEPSAALDRVKADIERAVDGHLDPAGPLRADGSRDPKKARGFGEKFYPTEIFAKILDIADVRSVDRLVLVIGGMRHVDVATPVTLEPDALLYPGLHEIRVEPLGAGDWR